MSQHSHKQREASWLDQTMRCVCVCVHVCVYNYCVFTYVCLLLNILLCSQEGPHSALNEEEFFDAVEMALDQQDEIESAVSHCMIS